MELHSERPLRLPSFGMLVLENGARVRRAVGPGLPPGSHGDRALPHETGFRVTHLLLQSWKTRKPGERSPSYHEVTGCQTWACRGWTVARHLSPCPHSLFGPPKAGPSQPGG